MRPSLRICNLTLVSAVLFAGCGSPGINHGPTGGNGETGGTGGSGGGGGGGTAGGTGGGGGGGGGKPNCGVQNFMLTKGAVPDLLLVQDKSGSMRQDAAGNDPGTPSKWTSMTMAINQVVSSVSSVYWGLLLFPDPLGGQSSCSVATMPNVPIAANNSMAIANVLSMNGPGGGTPTGDAINSAVAYLGGLNDMHSHYILLATDGEPDCIDPTSDTAAAEQAVRDAAKAGVKTIVVGIGANTGADAALTQMANDGGLPNMTAGAKPYYEVSTTMDLVTVLNKVAGQIVSCSYALQKAPDNPDLVEIDGNGAAIPRDKTHMNGWDFGPGNLSVNFYGAACDALQSGVTTNISAVYGCPPIG